MSDAPVTPVAPAPVNNVIALTTEQFQTLMAAVATKSPTTIASAVETGAVNVAKFSLAEIEQMAKDLKATTDHVHGAAKLLQSDVKANWPILVALALTGMNTVLIVKDVFHLF